MVRAGSRRRMNFISTMNVAYSIDRLGLPKPRPNPCPSAPPVMEEGAGGSRKERPRRVNMMGKLCKQSTHTIHAIERGGLILSLPHNAYLQACALLDHPSAVACVQRNINGLHLFSATEGRCGKSEGPSPRSSSNSKFLFSHKRRTATALTSN